MAKADSWVLRDLPSLLVRDWYDNLIGTEFDVQVAAYHHWRRYFGRDRNSTWRIRAQPFMSVPGGGRVKPDIVVYKGATPYDVMEIKCMLDGFSWDRIEGDLEKLGKLRKSEGIRHAYMLVVYDDDGLITLPSSDKDPWMKNYLTFVGANVRRGPTGRKRSGYDSARSHWQTYYR